MLDNHHLCLVPDCFPSPKGTLHGWQPLPLPLPQPLLTAANCVSTHLSDLHVCVRGILQHVAFVTGSFP